MSKSQVEPYFVLLNLETQEALDIGIIVWHENTIVEICDDRGKTIWSNIMEFHYTDKFTLQQINVGR